MKGRPERDGPRRDRSSIIDLEVWMLTSPRARRSAGPRSGSSFWGRPLGFPCRHGDPDRIVRGGECLAAEKPAPGMDPVDGLVDLRAPYAMARVSKLARASASFPVCGGRLPGVGRECPRKRAWVIESNLRGDIEHGWSANSCGGLRRNVFVGCARTPRQRCRPCET